MKILLSASQLHEGIGRLAQQLAEHYAQRPVTIVGVLTGSLVVLADLIRQLNMPLRVALVQARSYRAGATTPGALAINPDFAPDLKGRHVLVLDDIFDTGHTLSKLVAQINLLEPKSLHTAVLLRKQGRQEVDFNPDFVAFDIPDEFVVGYGLDYHDLYRNLPYVAALEPHEIQAEPPL